MKILIQKFGGTSVSTPERRNLVVEKVIKSIKDGYHPVVVVSAMGRKGESYATDTLLSLISNDFKGDNLLAADLLMSCGEIITSVVLSDDFFKNGHECVPLTGGQAGIITDNNYNNASVLKIEGKRIIEILNQGKIPVIAGFQGMSEDGYVTTLGRGGSDVTAALLGAALNAEEIDIYTDVDGIMTADPRIVSEACLIDNMSYNEVFQFADQGAKVIHPRAVEIAMAANIPIMIKNTMSNCPGTLINNLGHHNNNIITGITHLTNRVQINVKLDNNNENKSYDDLLDILADNCISIDLINVFPKEKIFTIDSKDHNKLMNIMKKLNLKYTFIDDCSKISIIGSRIRGVPGVMAKILRTLNNEKIEVLQTADSHTTIWCLVKTSDIDKAINVLHKTFLIE